MRNETAQERNVRVVLAASLFALAAGVGACVVAVLLVVHTLG
jgi:hypothetical protein